MLSSAPSRPACRNDWLDGSFLMKPRSTEDETNGLRYFPRMLDKIRLKAKGQLDPEYHENMGRGADRRLIKFLRVEYQTNFARASARAAQTRRFWNGASPMATAFIRTTSKSGTASFPNSAGTILPPITWRSAKSRLVWPIGAIFRRLASSSTSRKAASRSERCDALQLLGDEGQLEEVGVRFCRTLKEQKIRRGALRETLKQGGSPPVSRYHCQPADELCGGGVAPAPGTVSSGLKFVEECV